jgi:meso-butanediol dehydrogenase / (S,S)-butanediol dehydrogenase / diacetyl reductase
VDFEALQGRTNDAALQERRFVMTATTARFTGKTALVTGGGSGIGLAIVRRLLAEGAKVAACDLQADPLKALEAEFGPSFLGVVADVTKEAELETLTAGTVARFGSLDCAFNVAGASRPGYIVDLAETDWDFTVDLCLKGVFLAMKHQARHMIARGRGSIVNVASLNAHVPMHAGAAYASAKAGVEMLTRNGALEFAPFGVRVNAILPGLVQTPLTRRHFDNAQAHAFFVARIPLGRAGQPDEIAAPALFLASDDASYVSGSSLLVDGAWGVSGYPDMRPFRAPQLWPGNT